MSEKLGSFVKIVSGNALKSDHFSKDPSLTPVVMARDIDKGLSSIFTSDKIADENIVAKEGDILISMHDDVKIGIWKGKSAYLSQRVSKIEPNDDKLLTSYLYYFLTEELNRIRHRTSFASIKQLSVRDITSIEITVPPVEIQRQIVNALNSA